MKNSSPAIRFLPGLAVLLYLPYLNAHYFSDDFLFYYNSPPSHLSAYFTSHVSVAHAYRPLEAIFLTIVQGHLGFQTWPIHAAALLAHMLLCGLVIAAAQRLGFRLAETALAAGLAVVTQVGAPAILGNDTLSQAMSSMLGVLSIFLFALACFYENLERRPRIRWAPFCFSVLSFMASLFFKETALGFSLILCAIATAAGPPQRSWLVRFARAGRLLIPFGAAGLIYLAARIHAGGEIAAASGDTYKISAGFNVIRNLALFAAGALSPVSSVSVATGLQTHEMLLPGISAAGTVLIAAAILAGILTTRRKNVVLWLLGCSLAALFPAFLLQHVSELYFYNAVPFAALLFSLAFGSLWDKGSSAKAVAAGCVFLLIGGQALAARQKASLMYGNGRRAATVVASLVPFIRSIPRSGRIILVQPPGERLKYSVYVLEGFDILEFGEGRLGPIFGRPDVNVSIAENNQTGRVAPDPATMMLTLEGETLRPWHAPAF